MPRLQGKCFHRGGNEGGRKCELFEIFRNLIMIIYFLGGEGIFLKDRIRFGTKWTKFSFVGFVGFDKGERF